MDNLSRLFKINFSEFISTLKDTSFDDKNGIYLCNNITEEVYNFDKIVRDRYNYPFPSSPDLIMIYENTIYLIEFKNQDFKRIKAGIVKKKLQDGQDIISKIFVDLGLDISNYKFNFCVVYKNKLHKHRIGTQRASIRFELEQYKNNFFDNIYTNNVDYFTSEFKKYFNKDLIC
jgi:hypothetical protein